ncbi:MAG: hypothetical protein ABIG87_00405 [Patescibacteria group bacterium]
MSKIFIIWGCFVSLLKVFEKKLFEGSLLEVFGKDWIASQAREDESLDCLTTCRCGFVTPLRSVPRKDKWGE